MRIAALAVFVCLLGAANVHAQTFDFQALTPGTIVTSDDALPKMTFRAGTSTIDIRAERGVDMQGLLVAAKIRPNDDPQTIVDKVNKVRTRLYPTHEIAITASVPRDSERATSGVRLWRYYLGWNRTGRYYAFWNPMLVAVSFLNDVRGTWQYYECNGCASWRYMATIGTGGAYTRALTGYNGMGFDFRPQTYGARADIVMFFFD